MIFTGLIMLYSGWAWFWRSLAVSYGLKDKVDDDTDAVDPTPQTADQADKDRETRQAYVRQTRGCQLRSTRSCARVAETTFRRSGSQWGSYVVAQRQKGDFLASAALTSTSRHLLGRLASARAECLHRNPLPLVCS